MKDKTTIAEFFDKMREQETFINDLHDQISNANKEIFALRAEKLSFERKSTELSKILTELESRTAELEALNGHINEELTGIRTENERLVSRCAVLESENAHRMEEWTRKESQWKAEMNDLSANLRNVTVQRDELMERLRASPEPSPSPGADPSALAELQASLQRESDRAKTLEEAAAQQKAALESSIDQLQDELESVRSEAYIAAGNYAAQIEGLTKKDNEKQLEIEQLQLQLRELSAKVSNTSAFVGTHTDKEYDELRQSLTERETDVTDLQSILTARDDELRSLHSHVIGLTESLTNQDLQLSAMQAMCQAAKAAESEAKEDLARVSKSFEELIAKETSAKSQLAEEIRLLKETVGGSSAEGVTGSRHSSMREGGSDAPGGAYSKVRSLMHDKDALTDSILRLQRELEDEREEKQIQARQHDAEMRDMMVERARLLAEQRSGWVSERAELHEKIEEQRKLAIEALQETQQLRLQALTHDEVRHALEQEKMYYMLQCDKLQVREYNHLFQPKEM